MTTISLVMLLAGCKPTEEPVAEPSPSASPLTALPSSAVPSSSAAPVGAQFIAIGTEPFWNASISGDKLFYSTPEDMAGQSVVVTQSQDGASRQFTGTLAGKPFVLKLRLETCSDGMSERSYRYAADLVVAGEARKGCAEPGIAFKPE